MIIVYFKRKVISVWVHQYVVSVFKIIFYSALKITSCNFVCMDSYKKELIEMKETIFL